MVRAFFLALRASTAIAVQICAQFVSLSDLAMFERSRSCQKRDTTLRPLQKIVLSFCGVEEPSVRLSSVFADKKACLLASIRH